MRSKFLFLEKIELFFAKVFLFLHNPKNKKILLILFGIIFCGIFLPSRFALSFFVGDVLNWVKWLPVRIPVTLMVIPLYIAAFLTIPFVGLSGLLVRWTLSPDFTSFPYTKPGDANNGGNPIIKAGLDVTLPLANMIIILCFVAIAIATILRIESYSFQKLLPTLIIIALLVNFAPVLCGLVVDAGNVTMNFFAGHLGGISGMAKIAKTLWGEGGFWHDIMGMWGLHSGTEMAIYVSPIAKTLSIIIYNCVATLILFMFFILFILRYIMIWLLVILSPIAFVSYILPATRGYFKKWWNQLLQWSFVGAIGAFFLFLGGITMSQFGNANLSPPAADTTWLTEIINSMLPALFSCTVLLIGFFMTLKGGAIGATLATSAAVGAASRISSWTGKKSWGAAQGFFGKEGTKRYELARRLEKSRFVPIKPGTLTGARRAEIEGRTEEYRKQFKLASTNELKDRADRLKRLKIFGKDRIGEARGLIEELTARGELDASYAPIIKQLESQGYVGEAKKAKKKLPILAIDSQKSRQENEATLKELFESMTNEEKQQIQPNAYTEPLVTQAALRTVTSPKEFSAIISNYKAARAIGQGLSGKDINDIEAQNPVVARQLKQERNQRKMGIRITGDRITPA